MLKLSERFIRYTKIDTQSNEESTTCPSTNKQFNLAKVLKDEFEDMGINKTESMRMDIFMLPYRQMLIFRCLRWVLLPT